MAEVSQWVARFAPLVTGGGAVLDLACGGGRHGRYFLDRGHPVTLLDRDVAGVADLGDCAEVVQADLEDGSGWPLAGRRYAAVVVINYLHRPLLLTLCEALAPGGLLLYETFSTDQPRFGRPGNPDFLLRPGELLDVARAAALRVLAYEDLVVDGPRAVQRIAALMPTD